jgi:hypothetical protein
MQTCFNGIGYCLFGKDYTVFHPDVKDRKSRQAKKVDFELDEAYTGSMRVVRVPVEWLTELGELIRPKTEQQRRDRVMAALVVLAVLVGLYYYFV